VCGRAGGRYRLSNLQQRLLRPVLGDGLTVAEGRSWALQRKLAGRLMPSRLSEARAGTAQARIDAALDEFTAQGARVAARPLTDGLVALSIDLIAQVVFEHDPRVASQAVLAAITRHREQAEAPDWRDAAGFSPQWSSVRMRRSHRIAHSLDDEIAASIRAALARPSSADGDRVTFGRDFVVSLIAGFESITATTLWLLLVCALDRTLQDSLRRALADEDPAQLQPQRGQAPGVADAWLAELLRLYPPLPLVFRVATKDDETPAGPIPRGAMVCISPWIVHRHQALWVDPERFDLERHRRDGADLRGYMPFGVGARRCVGMHVGNHLVKAIARRLLARFEVSTNVTCMPAPRASMTCGRRWTSRSG
ncbi:MAG TPA: cytochrome P450, partial [Burkholderiaceae bacterium]|nr:cytochrome P450 [Burkholderiaceae bacterium]